MAIAYKDGLTVELKSGQRSKAEFKPGMRHVIQTETDDDRTLAEILDRLKSPEVHGPQLLPPEKAKAHTEDECKPAWQPWRNERDRFWAFVKGKGRVKAVTTPAGTKLYQLFNGVCLPLDPRSSTVWDFFATPRDLTAKRWGGCKTCRTSPYRHGGVDFGTAKAGVPIPSVADGVVEFADPSRESAWGIFVMVKHAQERRSLYAHLSRVDVQTGSTVTKGQLLGVSGNTGPGKVTYGHHLHYAVGVGAYEHGGARGPKKSPRWHDPFRFEIT